MPGAVIGGSVVGYREITAYEGPGDVSSVAAFVWWGLRAYSQATVGTAAIRLRRDSDNAESDFSTIAGGGLDTSAISSWAGGANLFAAKVYDQIASLDQVQATAGTQPSFTLTGGPSSKPTLVGTSSKAMAATTTRDIGTAITVAAVAKTTTTAVRQGIWNAGPNVLLGYDINASGTPTADLVWWFAGAAVVTATATDGAYHSLLRWDENGGEHSFGIDGVEVSTATGGNIGGSSQLDGIMSDAGGNGLIGNWQESGTWSSVLNGGNRGAITTNASNYWGI